MITETVFLNRDNLTSVKLFANGTAQDITGTTRMTLQIGDVVLDSNIHTTVFDWDTHGADGQLDLVIGHQTIPIGTYVARLVVFDLTYPNGIEWDQGLVLRVKGGLP